MALRNIVLDGDPILRKVCRPVDRADDRTRLILDDMLETMRAAPGVGLAAPQIGIMRRMFVVETEPDEVYYVINPEVLEKRGAVTGEEGCLSVPGYCGVVERPEYIKIKALDRNGKEQIIEAEGFLARAMSHEYDHLDGILYTDKAQEIYELDDEEV